MEQLQIRQSVGVRVGRSLEIPKAELPEWVLDRIRSALTIPNEIKIHARKESFWGWEDLPDWIVLYGEDDAHLTVPRGFALKLRHGLDRCSYEVNWADERMKPGRPSMDLPGIVPRGDYQRRAWERMLEVMQGIWKAPPGAGKTVAVLEAWRLSDTTGLVIVNTTNIVRQWIERSEQFLGLRPGIIGDGEWDPRPLTIATQQTLWSRRDDLERGGFFDEWGFVCLDECHHLPAYTFTDIIGRFGAYYRLGVSATPELRKELVPVMEAVLGELFLETTEQDLIDADVYVKPSVEIVDTPFARTYFGTHVPDGTDSCQKIGCTRVGGRVHRNNYQSIIEDLIRDPFRNELIADTIMRHFYGHACLVLSQRLEHLDRLRRLVIDRGVPEEDAIEFTGRQSSKRRMEIQHRAEAGDCVLFSTIADEAVDIPRLDRLFLAYPGRNTGKVEQRVGRIKRTHRAKKDAIVIDFVDPYVSVLQYQYWARLREVYSPQGMLLRDQQGISK